MKCHEIDNTWIKAILNGLSLDVTSQVANELGQQDWWASWKYILLLQFQDLVLNKCFFFCLSFPVTNTRYRSSVWFADFSFNRT